MEFVILHDFLFFCLKRSRGIILEAFGRQNNHFWPQFWSYFGRRRHSEHRAPACTGAQFPGFEGVQIIKSCLGRGQLRGRDSQSGLRRDTLATLGRLFGGRFEGRLSKRRNSPEIERTASQVGGQSLSKRPVIWLDLLYLYIFIYTYIYT